VDITYPAHNRRLAQRIAEGGLLVSEFPMGTPAYPQNFPIRNRIVSGLSAGVLVVEGSQYSGSAITARLAVDQNREVFAVPGNITSPLSWSPNLLIKQGAHLVQSVEDVLDGLPAQVRVLLQNEPNSQVQASLFDGASGPLQAQLLEVIGVDTPVSLDDLVEQLIDNSPSEIIAALLELELSGRVRQLPGKTFVRVWV
jgi:DNA processing protein